MCQEEGQDRGMEWSTHGRAQFEDTLGGRERLLHEGLVEGRAQLQALQQGRQGR